MNELDPHIQGLGISIEKVVKIVLIKKLIDIYWPAVGKLELVFLT